MTANNNKDQQKTDQLTHIITVISATNNGNLHFSSPPHSLQVK